VVSEKADVQCALLEGKLPPEASGALLRGLRGLLLRYAEAVAAHLSCDDLVPPPPPLVRYKREVVVKAEAVDAGRKPSSRWSPLPIMLLEMRFIAGT